MVILKLRSFISILFTEKAGISQNVQKLLKLNISVFGVAVAEQNCLPGWTGPTNSGKCYQIMRPAASPILEAEALCKKYNSNLASIKDQIEQVFVNTYILPQAQDWLVTGLSRFPGTLDWTWADGTPSK